MKAVFTRIRFRILAIVLMAIIPAIGLIFYSAAERKGQISHEIEYNAVRLSRFLASNLERDISEGNGFLKATAELLESKKKTSEKCPEILANLLVDDSSSVYGNLGVADPGGRILCSASPMPQGASLAKLDWLPVFYSRPEYTVGFDLTGNLSHEASINLAYPIPGDKGGAHDILFAVMDLDWLNTLAQRAQLPEGSAISVTNRSGDAVARYPDPDKWVGKPYPRAHFLIDETSAEGVKLANGIDGVKRLYAYAAVRGKGKLVVYVGIRREAAYAPANRALANQLAALGVVSLLALLAAWFGADLFLIQQIRALISATKNLGAGNLTTRSSLSYDMGELGELARAFDEMAETLEWRDAQLRESENERANSTDQLFEIMESIPEPCMMMDESFSIRTANRLARDLFGYAAEEIIGLSFHALCPDVSRAALLPQGVEAQDHETPAIQMKMKGRVKDGTAIHIAILLSRSVFKSKIMSLAIFHVMEENGPNQTKRMSP
jgi:PAS domain S-box-containing protein